MEVGASKYRTVQMGSTLSSFIEQEDFPVDMKDAVTGKYLENNQLTAVVSGLVSQDRIGLDVYDIGRINGTPSAVTERIVAADRKVDAKQMPVRLMHVFLDKLTHELAVDRVTKQAVVNAQGKMVGILSYAQDMIPYMHRADLYSFYKGYFWSEAAVHKLLSHLKLLTFFRVLPTEVELILLLHAKSPIEKVATILQLSFNDIRSHRDSLKEKLLMIDYDEMVQRLSVPECVTIADA